MTLAAPPRPPSSPNRQRRPRRPAQAALLLALLATALLITLIQVNALGFVYTRLGLSAGWALAVLVASIAGGAVNLPVARIRARSSRPQLRRTPFGWLLYVGPAHPTVVALNVGGALIPIGLSTYLLLRTQLFLDTAAAVTVVSVVVHRAARVVPTAGVVLPPFLPAISACAVALLLHPAATAAVAYIGGTIGTLVGADLTNLGRVIRDGPPFVSIGGAGSFDGIVLAGTVAVLLVSLL